jgi:K+-transporting ATPase KdpF subunit
MIRDRTTNIIKPVRFGGHHEYWTGGYGMTLFDIVGLIIAVGLVVYLFIALLKPELFS